MGTIHRLCQMGRKGGFFFAWAATLIVFLLAIPGCGSQREEIRAPVMEEIGFSYLEETGTRIRTFQQQALQDLAAHRIEEASDAMKKAMDESAVLLFYDIPITEIRQLVFDAGRLYVIHGPKPASANLDRAAALMQRIADRGGPGLSAEMDEGLLLTEDLLLALNENSSSVVKKFETLSHKVNMLAMKSDLVLSGEHFSTEEKTGILQ